jgi:prepilin-type N-terminal cleavage/methylation domain-containing protein
MKIIRHSIERDNRQDSRGFTLLELMVVVVIIGMLSTLIIPSMVSAVRRGGTEDEAEQLLEMIHFARMSAISRHARVVLNIDTRRSLCWLSNTVSTLPWNETEVVDGPRAPLASFKLGKGIEVMVQRRLGMEGFASTLEWETIVFESDGTTEDLVVSMRDDTGKRIDIQVYGTTGAAMFREAGL